eukprot:12786350-Ditylum_brightwellii.AAC.1
MSHNSSSAIGLLNGAGKCANMPLTSRSLAACFFNSWRHTLNVSPHTPFGSVSILSGFCDVRDVSTRLNSCLCISAPPLPPVTLLPGRNVRLLRPQ